MLLWLCVVVRIVANPLSNVFQKVLTRRTADPLFIVGATHALLSLACVPLLAGSALPASSEFWGNILASALLCIGGNVLIVEALKRSDLSVLGPINAWKPVVGLVPGAFLLSEAPGATDLAGIALVVAGSLCLVDRAARGQRTGAASRFFSDPGVRLRFAALVLSATEAVFLKKALHASTVAVTFAWWSVSGLLVSAVAVVVMLGAGGVRREAGLVRTSAAAYAALALTTGLMQFCTIVVLGGFAVGPALALFQTSALLSVVLGHAVFREPDLLKRLLGSAVMTAGAVLIVAGR